MVYNSYNKLHCWIERIIVCMPWGWSNREDNFNPNLNLQMKTCEPITINLSSKQNIIKIHL